MTSIKRLMDLVKSKTYKRKSYLFLVGKLQEKFNAAPIVTTKTQFSTFFRFNSFVIALLIGNYNVVLPSETEYLDTSYHLTLSPF